MPTNKPYPPVFPSPMGVTPIGYTYSYPNPGEMVNKLTYPNGSYVTNIFDSLNRITSIYMKNSSHGILGSHGYQFNPENQRTRHTRADGSYVDYAYDNAGQLTTALGKETSGSSRLHEQFGYGYDAAHNLNWRTNNALNLSFQIRPDNTLMSMQYSGTLTVAGSTSDQATNVTVNGQAASIYGDQTFARAGFAIDSYGAKTFTAVAQASTGSDTNSVTLNFPWPQTTTMDANKNLTSDGRFVFSYTFDGWLRTIYNYTTAGVLIGRTEFKHDAFGRVIEAGQSDGYGAITNRTRYVYSGRLVLQERDENNQAKVTYTRGLDLSGSMEGAGGIGGLLARNVNAELPSPTLTAYYFVDGNGNVSTLINNQQQVVARYLYDPFGNTIVASGPLADANTYRFSSKEIHPATGLYNFGQRWYHPNLQRWLSKDPGGMVDGPNLYAYVGNGPTCFNDAWGLKIIWDSDINPGEPSDEFIDQWKDAMRKLRRTKIGRKLLSEAEKPLTEITLLESSKYGASGNGFRKIDGTYFGKVALWKGDELGLSPAMRTEYEKWPEELAPLNASPEKGAAVILGHELGHIFSILNLALDIPGKEQSGYEDPENVVAVENPIRKDLGLKPRRKYHGKDIYAKDDEK